MARNRQRLIRIGRGMGFIETHEFGLEYAPLYTKLIISETPDMLTIVWTTDTSTGDVTVNEQVVLWNFNSASIGLGSTPYENLDKKKYYYSQDYGQAAGVDPDFRLQGTWEIVTDVGPVDPPVPAVEKFTFGTVDLQIKLAGTVQVTAVGGGVSGPISAVVDNLAGWANTAGTAIKDLGVSEAGFVTNPLTVDLNLGSNSIVNATLKAVNTQDAVTAVTAFFDIYNGDPINNVVRFDLPVASSVLDGVFIFTNSDTTVGMETNFMAIRPFAGGTVNGISGDFILSHRNEVVTFWAQNATNWKTLTKTSLDVASVAMLTPVSEAITTTPTKLTIADTVAVTSNGRLEADIANDQINVVQLSKPVDAYQLQLNMTFQAANNVEIFIEVFYNGLITTAITSVAGRGSNDVGLSLNTVVGVSVAPAAFEIFVSAGSAGTIDWLTSSFFVNRLGG